MGIREKEKWVTWMTMKPKEMYLTGKIWLVGEMIEANGIEVKLYLEVQTILHLTIKMVKCIRHG